MTDETGKDHLRLVHSQTPEQARLKNVLDYEGTHRQAAERIMNSSLVKDMLELELDDRPQKLRELIAVDELPDSVDVDMDDCVVLSDFGWAEWGYLEESLKAGPDADVYDTTRHIVANALARYAAEQRGPDAS